MEQATHLKQTVEKLDHALVRLQEIQSALRGHSPLSLPTDPNPDKVPPLSIFYELGDNYAVQSGSRRRWSMPTPLTHDHVLSDAVAVSKFAKKTVDMVKVQKKKQAAKGTSAPSFCSLQADQASVLRSSNRINLLHQVDMSTSNDASRKPRDASKENKRTPRQRKLELKDDTEVHNIGGSRNYMSTERHRSGKSRDEEASLRLNADNRVRSFRIGPEEEDVRPNILKLRALKHVEDATTDPCASHGDGNDLNLQDCNANAKRKSLSMRTLMRMEDEEKECGKPSILEEDKDANSFSSAMASKSFSVQLEEIKSSKKKSWSFTHQGRASDNVVVMFPNPTFDESTPPPKTPPEYQQKVIDASITKQTSYQEKAPALPMTMMKNETDRKGSFPKKEKIVRLSPCITSTSTAQKPRSQVNSVIACASTSKRAPPVKKQKWLCTITHPPSPTLIRRLPEAHEMKEIKLTCQNYVDKEDKHCTTDDLMNDNPDSLRRSWHFGNPSTHGSSCMRSGASRSSHNPSGDTN